MYVKNARVSWFFTSFSGVREKFIKKQAADRIICKSSASNQCFKKCGFVSTYHLTFEVII